MILNKPKNREKKSLYYIKILFSSHGLYKSMTTSVKNTVYFILQNTFIIVFHIIFYTILYNILCYTVFFTFLCTLFSTKKDHYLLINDKHAFKHILASKMRFC